MRQLFIIVGLPGSGKTKLCQEFGNEFKIYDDFLDNIFDGQLINDIELGKNLCITDPRLTQKKSFDLVMNSILNIIDKKHFKLIVYENNPQQAIKNIRKRNNYERLKKDIKNMSKYYDLQNYKKYNPKIIPVWKPNF